MALPHRLASNRRLLRDLYRSPTAAAKADRATGSIPGVQRPGTAIPGQRSSQHGKLYGSERGEQCPSAYQ